MIRRLQLLAVSLLACLVVVSAEIAQSQKGIGNLSAHEIEHKLQTCEVAKQLAAHKVASSPSSASFTAKLFAVLFPSSKPAVNALLATAYISGPPNFLLALCPPNIDPASLSVMVAFAVGGLLGDTLFHLLPEIFLGEDEPDKVRFVVLEPNRNLLLGVGILVGLVTFMGMDKFLRIATGGEGHEHTHSHSKTKNENSREGKHEETPEEEQERLYKKPYNDSSVTGRQTRDVVADLADANARIRRRAKGAVMPSGPPLVEKPTVDTSMSLAPINPSAKMAGVLNLVADFTHNITDGLAMSSSFYASPALGATTTMAVFFHEIPHEVGDFALLIQSGFSKRHAMGAQFVTATGAFIGTFIGIFVQEYGGNGASESGAPSEGIWGTSLQWGDMLLPFTAGTFLYVGTVAVIPELLETGPNRLQELKKTAVQFMAMFVGAAIMLGISWS